jgi:serine/threonine-protein kinase
MTVGGVEESAPASANAAGADGFVATRELADLAFGDSLSSAPRMSGRHLALISAESLRMDLAGPLHQRLGDYQLIELIGEGGMGIVYRARQISLDREVAVKILAAGPWASTKFVERFHREAQNAARMQHPNIVAIHEVGAAEELHYYSMRLVRGETLANRVRREGRFAPAAAARLMLPIARAIDYAHGLGVLHLDLKPANILLDETGVPHVADFGLARRLEQELGVGEDVSGTPSYMAPEQAAAGTQPIGTATDVWGLGAILYELVAGAPPFLGDCAETTMRLVREGTLRRPRRYVASLPRDLEAVIERAMARDASQRYASAAEFAADLESFIAGLPVRARGLNPLDRLLRWTWRERKFVIAAALACTGLVAAFVVSMQRNAAIDIPGKSIAVLPFENLSQDAENGYFADGMQDEILSHLAGISDLKVVSRTSTQKYKSHPTDLKTIGAQLGVATILEGSVQKSGEQVHINLQLIDARDDRHLWAQSYSRDLKNVFAVEGEVAQSVAEALKAKLMPAETATVGAAPTQNATAYEFFLRATPHYNRGNDRHDLAGLEMPQAIALYQQAIAADPRFALAYARLAIAETSVYNFAPDRTAVRIAAAQAAVERALALQPNLGEAHFAMGLFELWARRDFAGAREQLEITARQMPNNAEVIAYLAATARHEGRWQEALDAYRRAVQLDPQSTHINFQLAFTYADLRRYADAMRVLDEMLAAGGHVGDIRSTRATWLAMWKGDLSLQHTLLAALTPGSDEYEANERDFFQLAWWSRDYGAAIRTALTSTDVQWRDANNITLPRLLYLAWAFEAHGDQARAADTYLSVQNAANSAIARGSDSADQHLALAFAAAGMGQKEAAVRESARALEILPPSRDTVGGIATLCYVAQIEVRSGAYDAAFAHLRQLLALPSGTSISAAMLTLDPQWDPIRHDTRFAELLKQAGSEVQLAP